MTDLNPVSVRLLISRVRDVERCYGTLTDKMLLGAVGQGPMIFPDDLTLFKQIVENGVMADPMFRSPKGYEVFSFLTALCCLQEADRARVDREQRAEMNAICKKHGLSTEQIQEIKDARHKPLTRGEAREIIQLLPKTA